MQQPFTSDHKTDDASNPTGGTSSAVGISVNWQDGPLGRDADRQEPNGAFVETVLAIALDRLDFYQASHFACQENAEASHHIAEALRWLNERTKNREARAVEGTHTV